MKVGDLVKWTHPQYPSIGIIVELWLNNEAYIYWCEDDDTDGLYPLDHEHLEFLSEGR
jgi:hypothetical protein